MTQWLQVSVRLSTPEEPVVINVAQNGGHESASMPPGVVARVAIDGREWFEGIISPEDAEYIADWIDQLEVDSTVPYRSADPTTFDVVGARAWLARETERLRREVQKALSDAVDVLADRKAAFDRWGGRP